MREHEDASRAREAGSRDEVEGVVANTLKSFRRGAVGFIDWFDLKLFQLAPNIRQSQEMLFQSFKGFLRPCLNIRIATALEFICTIG